MVQMFMRDLKKVSALECPLWRGFVIRDSLGIRPGQNFLFVLDSCSLQRMSALGRFHCILKFIRPSPNHFYDCQSIIGIKLVTRLRLGLSHLREHKFKHSFQDTLNPLCNCEMDVESSNYFLLQCFSNINERRTLMNTLDRINIQISQKSLQLLTNTLILGN